MTAPRASMSTQASSPMGHRARWWATAIFLGCWMVVHVLLIILATLPPNALATAAEPAVRLYVHPVFEQNWQLFAPNPAAKDIQVYVRGPYDDNTERRWTDWIGLSEPLFAAIRRNPFSPLNLLALEVDKAALQIENGLILSGGYASASDRDRVITDWESFNHKPTGLAVLEALGSAALQGHYPSVRFNGVQVMLTVRRIPPPSDHDGAPTERIVFHTAEFGNVARF